MKTLLIEYLLYEKQGRTCCRCTDSANVIQSLIKEMEPALRAAEVSVEVRKVPLGEGELHLSNTVRINGRDIMEIVAEESPLLTICPSCSALTGCPTECRTFCYKGRIHDALPREMLVDALMEETSPASMKRYAKAPRGTACSCRSKAGL